MQDIPNLGEADPHLQNAISFPTRCRALRLMSRPRLAAKGRNLRLVGTIPGGLIDGAAHSDALHGRSSTCRMLGTQAAAGGWFRPEGGPTMTNQRPPNDPYEPTSSYEARRAASLDSELQPDPELAEGRSSGG